MKTKVILHRAARALLGLAFSATLGAQTTAAKSKPAVAADNDLTRGNGLEARLSVGFRL